MATSFSAVGICTALGPVYLGIQRKDRIQFKSILKIDKLKIKDLPQGIIAKTSSGDLIRRYQINDIKAATHMIFFNDQRFPRPNDRATPILITQIIRDETNKIGGNKAVVFSIEKVFEDSKALAFTYFSTINTK
jgi:hypothetical protein